MDPAAEVACDELSLATCALRSRLPRTPMFGREPVLCEALVLAEVACHPATIHTWTDEAIGSADTGDGECQAPSLSLFVVLGREGAVATR